MRISSGLAGPVISRVHENLVHGLSEYQAALIHYEALVGNGTLHTQLGAPTPHGVRHTFKVKPPKEFYKHLRRVPNDGESL